MKKITNLIKSNTKLIAGIVIGTAVSGGSVYAATILMNADQVGFDKTGTTLSSTDVQGALDELYMKTKNLYPMQGFNKSTLSNTNDSAKVFDIRDGNIYTVKKLADGNVWMTENLRLINKTISSSDSNLPSGSTWTVPASNISSFTTAYNTNAAYYDSTYGGYYSFYTATAGWGTNGVTSGSSTKDICPKGWRLPTSGSSGEFQTLYNNYNSSALMQGVPGFVLSGYVYNGSVGDQGSYGSYWSSTAYGANYAYSLRLNSSNVYPASGYNKYYGFSVRCVAK